MIPYELKVFTSIIGTVLDLMNLQKRCQVHLDILNMAGPFIPESVTKDVRSIEKNNLSTRID